MQNHLVRQAGVTLAELMIVVALVALLSLLAVPLTQGWSDASRAQLARDQLSQALSRTQALAFRNPQGLDRNQPAATLVIDAGGEICVYPGMPANAASAQNCNGSPSWKAQARAEVQLGSCDGAQQLQCLALGPDGQALSAQKLGTTDCQTTLRYCAKKGGQNVSSQL